MIYMFQKSKVPNNQKEKAKDRPEVGKDDLFIFNLEFLEFAILETIYFNCGEICKTKYLLINC